MERGSGRKTAVAIRHVSFEDLGSFEAVLRDAGYDVIYRDAPRDDFGILGSQDADLVVVLGGPLGAYEERRYPFLTEELRLIERRLLACRPTLGICLGAQLMARALGAHVYPSGIKEIGFGTVRLTREGLNSPLRHLGQDGIVLHWHGDTFDLPESARLLASTDRFENQAFALGKTALGLQFHPEVDAAGLESWLVGHAAELAGAGLDASVIRSDARLYGADMMRRGRAFLEGWLELPASGDPAAWLSREAS